ncbi:Cytochrome b561 [Sulfitobacter sp. DSM 110093]|uniref:cytochrome b n=1 Tax=Sulfitobacter sp. DSM 110093 TaxID=2883127 RepID=UPI001FACA456|nr:cytochrome b [Sulfitobacter sp. DSM 110093]UOA32791.1 Cytochrome b561 [Sulfitobacter sp. DSM 110093]
MTLSDTPARYGLVSRLLHWGMAALFAAQFVSAAAHWALPRENALREALWSYHTDLGITLFFLVLVRGVWGLMNISKRPEQSGRIGTAAVAGHAAIYALMVIVPASRILAAAGSTRGFSYLGIEIFAPRAVEVAWMQVASEWHGEMGWVLALLVLGHIAMAVIWHRIVRQDGVLERMAG